MMLISLQFSLESAGPTIAGPPGRRHHSSRGYLIRAFLARNSESRSIYPRPRNWYLQLAVEF